MECGLPAALSVMVTAAARAPAPVGVNVTEIVQVPLLAATELPQVLLCAKSPLFAPVTAMLVMVSGPFPELVNVTDCGELAAPNACVANVMLVLERFTTGDAAPVPLRVIACGDPAALSVIVTEAVRVPAAVGANVTLTVQVPLFAAMELPQVLDCA
jgi:hypothetical protein